MSALPPNSRRYTGASKIRFAKASVASFGLELPREHERQGIAIGAASSCRHQVPGLEHEVVHDPYDLLIRLPYARSCEVLANFAEHIAALGIERAHSEGVRIGLCVLALESQFFGGPHANELVAANHLLPVVEAVHSNFLRLTTLTLPAARGREPTFLGYA